MNLPPQQISDSPDQTYEWAQSLAAEVMPGMVFALSGDLGAGKTCFVQGLADGLGVQEPVNSPTFTLVNEYSGRLPVYHLDLYRLSTPEEALDFGIDNYLYGQGVTLIEWAERLGDALPDKAIHLNFRHGQNPDQRIILHEKGES